MPSLQSMTGFARGQAHAGAITVTVEIKSVNNKGLDIRLRYSPGHDALDLPLRRMVQDRFARGSFQVNVTVAIDDMALQPRINEPFLARLIELSSQLVTTHSTNPPSADGLLAIRGVIEMPEGELDDEARAAVLDTATKAMGEALDGVRQARLAEGKAIAAVLSGRVDEIAALVDRAEADPSRDKDVIAGRMKTQVEQLLDASSALDPARLHAEAALLATKADIREELDRLHAHVAAARKLLGDGGAVGRKLDFLAQEINRESNTLCSKSNAVSVTEIGLQLKLAVDQFREQVQNVE